MLFLLKINIKKLAIFKTCCIGIASGVNHLYNLKIKINKIIFSILLFIVLLGRYSTIILRLDYIIVPLLLLCLQLIYKPKYSYKEILFILLLVFMMLWPIFIYQNLFSINSFKYLFYVIFGMCISKLMVYFYNLILPKHSFIWTSYITIIIFFIINLIIAIWEITTGNHLHYGDVRDIQLRGNTPADMFLM